MLSNAGSFKTVRRLLTRIKTICKTGRYIQNSVALTHTAPIAIT